MSNEEVEYKGRPNEILAFSRFKEEIEREASEKAKIVEENSVVEVKQILEAGKKESDRIKADLLVNAKREADQIRIREVSRKKLNVKMEYLRIRDEVFDEILLEARSKLQKYTKTKKYGELLVNLLGSSALSIDGGELVVHLRSDDKSLLTQDQLDQISKEVSKITNTDTSITVAKSDLSSLGGLKIIRSDNKLFIDNTFEAILTRKEDEIRVALVETLES